MSKKNTVDTASQPVETVQQSNSVNSTAEKLNQTLPMRFLIPTRKNSQNLSKELAVFLAIKNYKEYKGNTNAEKGRECSDVPRTWADISVAISNMTGEPKLHSQSYISKAIKEIQNRKIAIDNDLFTIEKDEGIYKIIKIDEEKEQFADCLTPKSVFYDNPNGISSIFALKVGTSNIEAAKAWVLRQYGADIFKTFTVDDTLIVFLSTASTTYAQTSRALRRQLDNDLINVNHTLRNIALSWKHR